MDRGHLKELQTFILQEQYEVSAVRKVEIPKPTGGMRMLGIPTVKDRLVQQAIHQELNRYYEPHFSDHSYGFRTGSPLSPLLSNIVLDELDRELEKRGLPFCRYADDCNIFVRSKKAGERVLESLTDFIERKLKLKVNRDKSGVRHCSTVKFLGYTVLSEGKIRVADKSIERLKFKIKECTIRNRGVSFVQVVKELNAVIIGWTNYFHLANSWLRRRLRCYRLKQCGRKHTIFKFLRSFDIPKNTCWNVVMYSHGWWNMSRNTAVNRAMNLQWFARLGLHSLQTKMKR